MALFPGHPKRGCWPSAFLQAKVASIEEEEQFELVMVPRGAHSLRSLRHGETFHPGVGPMEEARTLHLVQHDLAARLATHPPGAAFIIWDVGLGAAANALAMLEHLRALQPGPAVELHSFDRTLAPLHFALRHVVQLGYPLPWVAELEALAREGAVRMGRVEWHLHLGDFPRFLTERLRDGGAPRKPAAPGPHAVIFDPYSPATNPAMWSLPVLRGIRQAAAGEQGCTLSTYTRSTVVRVELLRAGWCVGHGAGTGEKTETTVAATHLELLHAPLGQKWLGRLRRSAAYRHAEVNPADEVAGCAQFRREP